MEKKSRKESAVMSNSSFVGHVDRREPTRVEMIRVGSVIDGVYQEHGFQAWTKKSDDPESKYNLELLSYRKAARQLPSSDRLVLDKAVKVIADSCKIGKDAAMQIIGKMGILFFVGTGEQK